MKLKYKLREVSTDDFYPNFDPPLIFQVRASPRRDWLDLAEALEEAELKDVSAAIQLLPSLAVSVSDGDSSTPLGTAEATEDFYKAIQGAMPDMAGEIICSLAYGLAIDCIREKKAVLQRLKEPSPAYANGSDPKEAVREL